MNGLLLNRSRMMTPQERADWHDYVNEYCTFTILEAGSLYLDYVGTGTAKKTLQYSINDGEWVSVTAYTGSSRNLIGNLVPGDTVKWSVTSNQSTLQYVKFANSSTLKFNLSGNLLSTCFTDFATRKNLGSTTAVFTNLFADTNIVYADTLAIPLTAATASSFTGTFSGCTYMSSAPELPATKVSGYTYASMFKGCTSLADAPNISGVTLAGTNNYQGMFAGCTSLVHAPELHATALTNCCYQEMFAGCTSLVYGPDLPVKNAAKTSCYQAMFSGCTSLVEMPEIAATGVTNNSCMEMFKGCSSLTTVHDLLTIAAKSECYKCMFADCTSLVTPQATLPATSLAASCYVGMYSGCTSLTSTPTLPAKNVSHCI